VDNLSCAGTVTLRNTKRYPFNDSSVTVALEKSMRDREYSVLTEILISSGETGDVVVTDRAVNGFKIAVTGSAKEAVIRYRVVGGEAL
jgi:hypothetical protein